MDKGSLFALTKLYRSSTLSSHLEVYNHYVHAVLPSNVLHRVQAIARADRQGDDDADYGLIMRSNELISSLNTELTAVFRLLPLAS